MDSTLPPALRRVDHRHRARSPILDSIGVALYGPGFISLVVYTAGFGIVESWGRWALRPGEALLATLRTAVIVCLTTGAVSSVASRIIEEQGIIIDSTFKLHFFPKFAEVGLALDLKTSLGPTSLPGPDELHMVPKSQGWEALSGIILHLRTFIGIVLQLCVQVALLYLYGSIPIWTVLTLGYVLPVMSTFIPSSRFGDAGYVFWTNDKHYTRLRGLHQMIFYPSVYRESLIKTGGQEKLSKDYAQEFEEVGAFRWNEQTLAMSPPPSWTWDFVRLLIDYCPILYGTIISYLLPIDATLLASLALMQLSYSSIKQDIVFMQQIGRAQPLNMLLQTAKRFYDALEMSPAMEDGQVKDLESKGGFSVSFRDVSFGYGNGNDVLIGVSFDVSPGDLVVIIGDNGCGKTTLLNLIARLMDCSSGSVLIDGTNIKEIDLTYLRKAMAILSQTDDLYPLSYRDNFLIGAPGDEDDVLAEACHLAGSSKYIEDLEHGLDSLYTPETFSTGFNTCFSSAPITAAVSEERDREQRIRMPTKISGGELQRLLLTRMFTKVLASKESCGLMLVDEGLSALDPLAAERVSKALVDFVDSGNTMIAVTHTLVPLVHRANLILRIEGGRIVERGTHAELLGMDGEYAKMYKAQTGNASFAAHSDAA
ncbi:P-loop containing nucleoside triphosphate hydrolase protein [Hymenopellis radicata]|nr:P-loop containing nucleoside triphosphate hydrolase protein [Hymenopellis radicata]